MVTPPPRSLKTSSLKEVRSRKLKQLRDQRADKHLPKHPFGKEWKFNNLSAQGQFHVKEFFITAECSRKASSLMQSIFSGSR